jgi:hypothetical protein
VAFQSAGRGLTPDGIRDQYGYGGPYFEAPVPGVLHRMSYKVLAAALIAAANVLNSADEPAAPAPAKGRKAAAQSAPESAPPAAAPAAVASAPAAQPPATAPEVPTPAAPPPAIETVNAAIKKLAAVDRPKAVAILTKQKVERTTQLKPEQYQVVLDDCEEATAEIDAAIAKKAGDSLV